ncbi:hypothetical protein RRG08_000893 [Elysia crispata]|uniref:Uncharacterized protein n=1 Tax=Elysia crispata TaxID=231223 RepID=A0AAE1D0A5_9GAST|nr:hypothetical protein RRG08_000893 [Elysia crispata]
MTISTHSSSLEHPIPPYFHRHAEKGQEDFELTAKRKKEPWSKAITMGKELRSQHPAEDKKVLMESLAKAFPPIKMSGQWERKRQPRKSPPTHLPPEIPAVHQSDLIAVACEDR